MNYYFGWIRNLSPCPHIQFQNSIKLQNFKMYEHSNMTLYKFNNFKEEHKNARNLINKGPYIYTQVMALHKGHYTKGLPNSSNLLVH